MTIAQNFPAISPSLLLDFANVQALDPRISYARATTATYYGTRTALAEQNLFTQSVGMSDWVISNSGAQITRVLNATTAPDNTSTATSIKSVSGNTQASLSAKSTERTFPVNSTISVYAKADGRNFLAINLRSSGGTRSVWFDLINGTVGTAESGNTGQIVNAGNGWYRCIATRTSSDIDQVQFYIADTDGSFTITNNDTIGLFVWGAQAEQRSTVTAYQVTTTQPVTNYIPVLETAASGVARFDHNPVTFESLGLLIEEQRTNLVTYSEQFDNANWIKTGGSVSSNVIVSPDGTLDADKLIEDTSTGVHQFAASVTLVASTTYAISIFAKADTRTLLRVAGRTFGSWSAFPDAVFNLSAGTVANISGVGTPIITAVGNGWYRCVVFGTTSATGAGLTVGLVSTGTTSSYTGDGYSGIYIWGAQLEAGAFSTSYIPTVASQVTRAADSASMTGTNFSSWYNQAEGSVYCEVTTPVPASTTNPGFMWYATEGIGNNRIELRQLGSGDTSPRINTLFRVSAVTTVNISLQTNTIGWTTNNVTSAKISLGYKVNDVYLTSDKANAPATDLDTTMPSINQVLFSHTGNYKKISYYPIRLSNTNLQALTG